jgi:hypothetical protein
MRNEQNGEKMEEKKGKGEEGGARKTRRLRACAARRSDIQRKRNRMAVCE